jgi:hypothetical protein
MINKLRKVTPRITSPIAACIFLPVKCFVAEPENDQAQGQG